ncbi:hypothetical protein BD309DRAFT_965904 [Dichomitus squalens]|uniref:Uncharacterized protein n=1 Tax=Dichomitus squalens TaxID=114155 RepID=A0A4Q9ME90_9APHY|nr:hypothetical protein BD311DRAFT_669104 [Dichomitus squalens]TBU41137.1 hypothetical protein BD309DRAFT_965904 [Dichomitus squalens]TBU52015.1 hypothetical protein BD310DRAFT_952947 [Dichomitus squalens]
MEAADWLKYICHGAKWAGPEYREHPERFVPTSKEPVDLTLHLVATGRATLIDFEIWKYAQRCSWTDERARLAASTFLMEHGWCASGLRQHLSTHDTGLVTLFLAEQLKGDSVLRPAFLHDKRLMAEVGIVTFFAMLSRSSWGSSSLGVQRTNAIMQRYFFYLLAFKWFAGKYCHYASILGLQDPMRAGVAVILAEGDMCSGKWKKSRVDVDTTFEGFDVTM